MYVYARNDILRDENRVRDDDHVLHVHDDALPVLRFLRSFAERHSTDRFHVLPDRW